MRSLIKNFIGAAVGGALVLTIFAFCAVTGKRPRVAFDGSVHLV